MLVYGRINHIHRYTCASDRTYLIQRVGEAGAALVDPGVQVLHQRQAVLAGDAGARVARDDRVRAARAGLTVAEEQDLAGRASQW